MRRLFVRPRVGAPFPRGLGWGPVSRPLAIRNPHPPGLSVRRRASQLAASKPGTSARNSYLCEPSCPASRLRLLGFADAPRAPLMARGCFLAGLRVLLGHSPRVLLRLATLGVLAASLRSAHLFTDDSNFLRSCYLDLAIDHFLRFKLLKLITKF